MYVTGWSNGRPSQSGAGYGVRISKSDRDRTFDRSWSAVVLSLGDEVPVVMPLSTSFWNRCSELRSAALGRWMVGQRLAPWPKGQPPQLVLRRVTENRFELERPRNSAQEGRR